MFAKLSETNAGDTLIADASFSCMNAGPHVVKADDGGGLYIECDEGEHYLNGQADDGEHMTGLTKDCQHEWKARDHDLGEVAGLGPREDVVCIKCGCHGERYTRTGQVDWPAT